MSRALSVARDRDLARSGATGGGGEVNTASSVGGAGGVFFKQKTGVNLEMKSILAGTGVVVNNNTNDITFTVSPQSGLATTWVQFNGSTLAIAASKNVASVTNPATGIYKITFTSALSSANYAVLGAGRRASGTTCYVTSGMEFPASSVSLLLHGNGANASTAIYDHSSYGHALTLAGDIKISTGTKKYGSGSLEFDGTGDWIDVPDHTSLHFGAGDFCIEFWLYMTSWTANQNLYVIQDSGGSEEIQMRILNGNPFQIYMNNSAFSMTCNPGISLSTWTHVALVRYGSTLYLYIDGVQKVTGTAPTITTTTKQCRIGAQVASGGAYPITGFMDDFRITKGSAVYTGAFTPPTAELDFPKLKTTTYCYVDTTLNTTLTALPEICVVCI